MNRGMLEKSARETWITTMFFGAGVGAAATLIAYILPTFFTEMAEPWLQMPIFQNIFKAILGTDVAGALGPNAVIAISWTHPLILILVATHAILFCSRMPAGEVDNGTADILLGLPVSRTSIYVGEGIVWLASGGFLMACVFAGNVIGGSSVVTETEFVLRPRLIAAVNLYCLYLAIGGVAWLASTLGNRRGRVCGVVYAIVLTSFLVNFLGPFSTVMDRLSVLSLLTYYRPLDAFRSGAWPLGDMFVLVTISAITWLAGAIIFRHRDIATV